VGTKVDIHIVITLVIVQWGDNQNGVFEFAMKEISHLPTFTTSQGLINWCFIMNIFLQNDL